MREIISSKNQELEDLQRNIKATKMYELQEELQIYQQECIKLRKLSENAVHLLYQHGLEPKLQGQILKPTNWQHSSFQQDAESIFDNNKSPESCQSNILAKQTSTSVNTSPMPPYSDH
jgi:hypothetical protein